MRDRGSARPRVLEPVPKEAHHRLCCGLGLIDERPVPAVFQHVKLADVGKLELYCFANCATSMAPFYAAPASRRQAPWIESYGNQYIKAVNVRPSK